MTDFEHLSLVVAGHATRLTVLENRVRDVYARNLDERSAQRIAEAGGIPGEVMVTVGQIESRRVLAKALRADNWSFERIARSLAVSEKTVRRWLDKCPDMESGSNSPA